MASTAIPAGAHPLHQRLHALAQARMLSGSVERRGLAHQEASREAQIGPVTVRGSGSAVAYGHARASGRVAATPGRTEAAFSAEAAGLLQAQGSVSAEALGVLRGGATIDASLSGVAHVEGRAVIGEQEIGLEASAGAVALARVAAQASGSANLGILEAHGKAGISAEAHAEASAHGRAWLGVDSLGLPAFSLGAAARTDAAAGVRSHAEGSASFLGLLEVGGSGSLKALAGAASSFLGSLSFRDGKLAIGAGLGAAAGFGAEAQAGVSVGLGKLPRGVTQTVVAPVLSVPVLLTTSLLNGVASLFGEEPWEGNPGITDLPEVMAHHVKTGIRTIGDGIEEVADQIWGGVSWLGRRIGSLFD